MAKITTRPATVPISSVNPGTIVSNINTDREYLVLGRVNDMLKLDGAAYGNVVVFSLANQYVSHSLPDWEVKIVGTLEP